MKKIDYTTVNESYWELSVKEKHLIEKLCGNIPNREALYWILPIIRLSKAKLVTGMKTYFRNNYRAQKSHVIDI